MANIIRTLMTKEQSIIRPSHFSDNNYNYCKARMRIFIQANNWKARMRIFIQVNDYACWNNIENVSCLLK